MKEAIEGLLNGILADANAESVAAYEGVCATDDFVELMEHFAHRQPDRFAMTDRNGPSRAVEGLLIKALGRNSQAKFLFQHADYVENQVRKRIEQAEGFQCGADKTRTVLRALARHLVDGSPIAFDYSGDVTYHLPATTLNTEKEIFGFFNAILRFYFGEPLPYLRYLTEYGVGQGSGKV